MNIHVLLQKIEEFGIYMRIEEGRLEVKDINKVDAELLQMLKEQEEDIIHVLCERDPSIKRPKFTKPYITESGELIIPFDSHPRYKYWLRNKASEWLPVNESLTIRNILEELEASREVFEQYVDSKQPK